MSETKSRDPEDPAPDGRCCPRLNAPNITTPSFVRRGTVAVLTGAVLVLWVVLFLGVPSPGAAARSDTASQRNRDLNWFPDQTLVSPPVADPRGPYTQGLVQSYHADGPVQDDLFDGVVAEGDVGFDYPLFGWKRSRSRGHQVSFEGGIYSIFLGEGDNAQDLVSVDYRVGFTLEGDRGRNRYRLHLYHESSHLGDEFAENTGRTRIKWSREALRLVYFRDFNRRRWGLYGGGEYNFRREQTEIDRSLLIAGFLRRFPYQLYMTADARFRQYADYDPFVSLQFGRHLFDGAVSIAVQYQEGPLPVGQFYREERSTLGVLVRINRPNRPRPLSSSSKDGS